MSIESLEGVDAFIDFSIVSEDGPFHVPATEWDRLEAAYSNWTERRIDQSLDITDCAGGRLCVAASRISSMYLSDATVRSRHRQRRDVLKEECGGKSWESDD